MNRVGGRPCGTPTLRPSGKGRELGKEIKFDDAFVNQTAGWLTILMNEADKVTRGNDYRGGDHYQSGSQTEMQNLQLTAGGKSYELANNMKEVVAQHAKDLDQRMLTFRKTLNTQIDGLRELAIKFKDAELENKSAQEVASYLGVADTGSGSGIGTGTGTTGS